MRPNKPYSLAMKLLTLALIALLSSVCLADYVPVAKWSGRLILPELAQRRVDGGVYIELENVPASYQSMKGAKVWLSYSKSAASWYAKEVSDVNFNQSAHQASRDGVIVPTRLDNWKRVSSLESLAGMRMRDEIQVALSDVSSIKAGEIKIGTEPTIIDGEQMGLVKFIKRLSRDRFEVIHYNQQTKKFNGPREVIHLDYQEQLVVPFEEDNDLTGIVETKANQGGWNIYGKKVNGTFVVQSLSPYQVFTLTSPKKRYPSYRARSLSKDYWKVSDEDAGSTRRFELYRESNRGRDHYNSSDRFLVFHTFGSYDGHGQTLGLYRGHAALGFANIVNHPITDAPIFNITYYQTYAHSAPGIFAGKWSWQAYNGNLYRGRMHYRPISDILLPLPKELTRDYHLKSNGQKFNFEAELKEGLERLSIGYRTGFGTGYAKVTLLTSCVHDSGNILLGVTERGQGLLGRNKDHPLAQKLAVFSKYLGHSVKAPENYRNADLLKDNVDFSAQTLFLAAKNLTITVPRNASDAFIKIAAEIEQKPTQVLQAIHLGGIKEEGSPRAPDRISVISALSSLKN